ncbi:MAG: UDP-N-acetylmuramate--L-alanine ligase [Lachnospiraceae bacterium]|jgi:UDP-N-acetylmuramate--alanine ligase|nr:UDP-N-acetylmuramate--L-alanine ligase [Lachnospiraceae bacterium]
MYKIDLQHPVRVYFIGIGGVSMSGLAQILIDRNFSVRGSDRTPSDYTKQLERLGATIQYGEARENITDDIDVVVYTAAVHPDNPEFAEAVRLGIPMLTRAQLLGQVMAYFDTSVAVAGTHGKTTTTSMISEILLAGETDPTISNGGILNSIKSNTRIGHSPYFVAEACEYTNSFFEFYPQYSVVLNIEEDHLDFFKDIDDIRHSFLHFMNNTKEGGCTVINGHIDNLSALTDRLQGQFLTFGLTSDMDYSATNITYDRLGLATYTLCKKGQPVGSISLAMPGKHNVLNSLAAIAVCDHAGISMDAIRKGLSLCTGSKRRFEKKGELNGITILDDYAHHPTEIRATLEAARATDFSRIVVVFQPHTYTRTKSLFSDFVDALSLADVVVVADIFAARETDTLGMSAELLSNALKEAGTESYYVGNFDSIQKFLIKKCMNGDLLITMGAGNVVEIGENLLK